jgi:hypothetical protein
VDASLDKYAEDYVSFTGHTTITDCGRQSSSSSRSALSIDIGGHISPQFTATVISSVVDFLPCHFVKLSNIFSRCLPLSFLPFILPVVTIFSNFPFLKMCQMNLDCFILNICSQDRYQRMSQRSCSNTVWQLQVRHTWLRTENCNSPLRWKANVVKIRLED